MQTIYLWGNRPTPCVGAHEHPCPVCYERPLCVDTCAREPDLEDNGPQSGCYAMCDACAAIAGEGE